MYLNHCIAEVFIHFIDDGIIRGYYDVILGSTYLTVHILGPGLKGGARTSLKEATKMEMCKTFDCCNSCFIAAFVEDEIFLP